MRCARGAKTGSISGGSLVYILLKASVTNAQKQTRRKICRLDDATLLISITAAATALIIVAAGDDLLARWPQHDAVLELSGVAAFDVAQRRVTARETSQREIGFKSEGDGGHSRFDDALVAQRFEAHEIPAPRRWQHNTRDKAGARALLASGTVQVSPAESEGGEFPEWGREGWARTNQAKTTAQCSPVDHSQQFFGLGQPQRHVTRVEVLHVVRAFAVFVHLAPASMRERWSGRATRMLFGV